jgi:hypothetical protein
MDPERVDEIKPSEVPSCYRPTGGTADGDSGDVINVICVGESAVMPSEGRGQTFNPFVLHAESSLNQQLR